MSLIRERGKEKGTRFEASDSKKIFTLLSIKTAGEKISTINLRGVSRN